MQEQLSKRLISVQSDSKIRKRDSLFELHLVNLDVIGSLTKDAGVRCLPLLSGDYCDKGK